MTPRQAHAQNLSVIASVSGTYNRRFSFKEAETFLTTFEYYKEEGYPVTLAADRAYDHYFIDRRSHR